MSNQDDGLRLRYVLDDPREEAVCLNDVIKAFVSTAEKLRFLEYKNSAHSLREGKKALRAAKKILVQFEERLKNEITEDVTKELSKIDKRIDPNNPRKNNEFLGYNDL